MGERMDKRIRFYIYWILGLVYLGLCVQTCLWDIFANILRNLLPTGNYRRGVLHFLF